MLLLLWAALCPFITYQVQGPFQAELKCPSFRGAFAGSCVHLNVVLTSPPSTHTQAPTPLPVAGVGWRFSLSGQACQLQGTGV